MEFKLNLGIIKLFKMEKQPIHAKKIGNTPNPAVVDPGDGHSVISESVRSMSIYNTEERKDQKLQPPTT